jgi:hypothetical protein
MITKPGADKPLQEHINWYVSQGYQVTAQTETSAQLVKPKRFSLIWAFLWFLALGVGLIVYLFWHVSKRDKTVYLYVEDGQVKSR